MTYGQKPQNTHSTLEQWQQTQLEAVKMLHRKENGIHSSPGSLSAPGGMYVENAAGQHNPETISESSSGLYAPQAIEVNYPQLYKSKYKLWNSSPFGELHLNYSNLQKN